MVEASGSLEFGVTERVREDGLTVVCARGEIDIATAPGLQQALERLGAEQRATLLDLSGVDFLDSTGLKVILRAVQDSERTGWAFTVLDDLTAPVRRLLELSGTDSLLPFGPAG